ncbi:cytochrome C [Sulfitobacter sp. SK012]|uniref:c-type cytochrome n=1 Tax=Sulfitobacter sp. SK012 TaxID=1389005 RepID=UPI000E0A4191|nr:cytochrome c [Sulfitobacter sp. SK012]AXI48728.1 cytochrome C [Sulfitobacter sp. SK012]
MNFKTGPFLGAVALIVLAGCETSSPSVDAAQGANLFAQNCAACHGQDARGAGPETLRIGKTPPDLTGLSRSSGGVFPRDRVLDTIDGFNRKNHPQSVMPEFGAGDLGPTVIVGDDANATPIPADLLALATYLESIQQ